MKKWIIGLLILAGIFIALAYIFIPSSLVVGDTGSFSSNVFAVKRTLAREDLWDKWSGGKFKIIKELSNGLRIGTTAGATGLTGEILAISIRDDSTTVSWHTPYSVGRSPFAKIAGYYRAAELKKEMNDVLQQFVSFCSKDSNVYGLNILQTSTKDTFLISTKSVYDHYPSLNDVYDNINKLRKYIVENNLAETDPPMLNVSTSDSASYRCMVAIPINRMVEAKGDIYFVRMVPGRFLTTALRGGPASIAQAHETMQQYFKDYRRTSMAIPFEYLVTDRLQEKDTTNWITKLYYPVY